MDGAQFKNKQTNKANKTRRKNKQTNKQSKKQQQQYCVLRLSKHNFDYVITP